MRDLRAGLAPAFAAYVGVTLLSAVPWLVALLAVSPVAAADASGGALLETVETAMPALGMGAVATFAALALTLAVSPVMQMAWLAALERPLSLGDAVASGLDRYWRAVGVSVLLIVPLIAVVGVLALLPLTGHLLLEDGPDARTHDLTVAALCVPGLVALVAWSAWHDLVRAALLTRADGVRAAVRLGLRAARPAAVLEYVFWTALGGALLLLAHAVGALLDGQAWWRGAMILCAGQALVFARFVARGRWLGRSLARVAQLPSPSPAVPAAEPPGDETADAAPADPPASTVLEDAGEARIEGARLFVPQIGGARRLTITGGTAVGRGHGAGGGSQ